MPCAYTIDCSNETIYLAAEGYVYPYEFIDTLRAIKLDRKRHMYDAVYLDMRRCKTYFNETDATLMVYYMGSLNRSFRGPIALVSDRANAPFYTLWVEKLLTYNIRIASFTRFSDAERWIAIESTKTEGFVIGKPKVL